MTNRTPIEPSDVLIERMLVERAGSGAPVELVATILTALDGVPQHPPAWPSVRRLRARNGSRWMLLAAGLGIVTITVAGAFGVGGFFSGPSVERTASPEFGTAVPSQTPAAPSSSPISGSNVPAGLLDDHAGYQFRLVSDKIGWVVTGSSVFRTIDGGLTWTDMSPAGMTLRSAAIVDADTVAIASTDGSMVRITTTHDGARSWISSSVDAGPANAGPILWFRSSSVGTATFYEDPNETPTRLRVYQTGDGGRTWTGPVMTTLPGEGIKLSGDDHGVLWLSNGKADNRPFDDLRWLSTDGGQTWQQRSFPTADPVAPAGTLKWLTGAPWVGDDGRIELAVSVGGETTDNEAIFESLDAGRSWRLVKAWPQAAHADFSAQPLSGTSWVVAGPDGSEIWSSTDDGATWRLVTGDQTIPFLSMSFGSPDHGLATHGCDPHPLIDHGPDPLCDGVTSRFYLLVTVDGGRTWTPVDR